MVGPKSLMHPDVEEALPGTTYNALTRRAGPPHFSPFTPPPPTPSLPSLPWAPPPLVVPQLAPVSVSSGIFLSTCHTCSLGIQAFCLQVFHFRMQLYMQSLPVNKHISCQICNRKYSLISCHKSLAAGSGMPHCTAAGGRLSTRPLPRRLVIDVREFMSSLPSVLHQQGLQIVPVTLEVTSLVAWQ